MTSRRTVVLGVVVAAAVGVAGAAGYQAWRTGMAGRPVPAAAAQPAAEARILYYRHPDRTEYAPQPRRTEDGRDFLAVRAGEDLEPVDPAAPPPPRVAAPRPGAEPGAPRRIRFYRNPMGLPDVSATPKKDSMGMDYIPVYEGEDQDDGTVRVSPGRIQATGVRSEPVTRREILRPIRAPGTVQIDERRAAVVALRAESFIERVEDITTGDHVKRGQPLLRLYSPEVAAAAAQYIGALGAPAGLGANAEGARRRLENLSIPPAVLAEIERTRRAPLSFIWPAPRDGVVLERTAVEGMRAMPGDTLFRLADTSILWVVADLPERELGSVALGQPAEVRPRGLPDRRFTGRVTLIYPQVDLQTRTARVRIELANSDGALLPGMYAEVEIAAGAGGPVVAVPDSAIIDSGTRQVVFLDRGEGRFEPRAVRVGHRGGGFAEIREGVAEGDRVVIAANFLIDAESNLRAALRGLTTGTEAAR